MSVHAWQIRASALGLGFALVLAVTAARAVDGNIYNGSECTFADPDHVDGQNRDAVKLLNLSGQTETISCPLTRDQTTNDVEYVYVIGSDDIQASTCKFWEREDDYTFASWTHDSVVAMTVDYDKIRWFDSTAYGNTTPWASYQITCDLPNNAVLYNYYLEEMN